MYYKFTAFLYPIKKPTEINTQNKEQKKEQLPKIADIKKNTDIKEKIIVITKIIYFSMSLCFSS